jgi:Protein of unknown function (DUF2786)
MAATIERIAALLAKAERTEVEAEADAYLMKAQQLATLASIDLAVARARTQRREQRQQPESRTMTIGEKGRRANSHLVSLYVVIAHANDAQVDVAANSTYVVGYGMPGDLDVIETMFGSLSVHMAHSGQLFVTSRSWVGETYVAVVDRRRRTKEHTAQTARTAFYRAYIQRIEERLREARRQAMADLPTAPSSTATDRATGEIVLREKAREVSAFHRQTSVARGRWGGYSGGVQAPSGTAAAAGRSAASRARLSDSSEVSGKRELDGA